MKKEVAPDSLAKHISSLADGIADFIHHNLLQHGRLPARSFYGESFSALLFGYSDGQYASSQDLLYDLYKKKDKDASNFHWEFNKYAWNSLYLMNDDAEAKKFALPLHFRNTPVTNWALLRSCTRYLAQTEVYVAYREALETLRHFQTKSGLICDEKNVRSFQYHCFSAVLVAEIYESSGESFFLDRFRHAANFIEQFVLRSGDTLYIGRGQEQSFGYGALLYLLATAFRHFKEPRYLVALKQSLVFLTGHRRNDGSFPLVMNDIEDGYPLSSSASNPYFPGWYAYNNYFDYLPFLGVFLRKTAETLGGVSTPKSHDILPKIDYRDNDFLICRRTRYEAVLARPGGGWKGGDGYWTNDLPFPYIVWKGERITPSYGGEQFGSTLYTSAGIPLPSIEQNERQKMFRDGRVWSFFLKNRLIFLSTKGVLVRHFHFLEDEIIVNDLLLGAGRLFHRYLFDLIHVIDDYTFVIRGGVIVKFSIPMKLEDSNEYYWGGLLQTLISCNPKRCCTVNICLGGNS